MNIKCTMKDGIDLSERMSKKLTKESLADLKKAFGGKTWTVKNGIMITLCPAYTERRPNKVCLIIWAMSNPNNDLTPEQEEYFNKLSKSLKEIK